MALSRRVKLFRLSLVLAAAGVLAALTWPHLSAAIALQSGKDLIESDPPEALARLESCLAIWPRNAEAHFYAADAAHRAGDADAALSHLDAAAQCGWDPAAVAQHRAAIHAELQELESKVRGLMAEFRWPEAESLLLHWLNLQPRSVVAWKYLGRTRERLRKLDGAVEAFEKAVALAPDDIAARLEAARLLIEQRNRVDDASRHVEHVVSLDAGHRSARLLLARTREAQGRTGEAVALLDRLLVEAPDDAAVHAARGKLELNRGDAAAALPHLKKAVELEPSAEEALYGLVQAYGALGQAEEAKAVEERWRRTDADLKRVRALGPAIAASPNNPDLRCEIGELFLRNGRKADGVRWLESALAKDPKHRRTHELLAAYYESLGDAARARRHQIAAAASP
jgi:tetratricopeptide (TPR) repeat protein